MKKPQIVPAVALAACLAGLPFSAAAGRPAASASPRTPAPSAGVLAIGADRVPGDFDPEEYRAAQFRRFEFLVGEAAPVTAESLTMAVAPAELLEQLDDDNCTTCGDGVSSTTRRVRVGVNVGTGIGVDFTDLDTVEQSLRRGGAVPHRAGMLRRSPAGDTIWTKAIESPDASALRVHFTDVALPAGAELYVYNLEGEAFGPYTGRGPNDSGDFWSNTILGPVAYVQLHLPAAAVSRGAIRSAEFQIAEVAHMDQRFLAATLAHGAGAQGEAARLCSYNATCVEDASCYGSSTFGSIDAAKAGVAHMLFVSGAFQYMCSGGLLNDTDTATQVPYFLTANHCISRSSEASSLECYWFYKTSSCGAVCSSPYGSVPRTLGSTLLAKSSTADYTFLRLNQQPPAGAVFLGWNATAIASTNGAALHRVSHPSGAPQAYSQHRVDTAAGTCRSWPRGPWIYSRDVIGATEGGSSGSPVLNAAGQVVGQLSGACGTNLNDTCDATRNATVDGAFAYYFASVRGWLDPSSGGGTGGGGGGGGGGPKK